MIDTNLINPRYTLTNKCNFNCDYCCNKKLNLNNYEPTHEDIDTLIDNLSQYKIGTFYIYGGEPTISSKFNYIINLIYQKLNFNYIRITTNCTNIENLIEISNKYDISNIKMYCSVHFKYINENIINNILLLQKIYNNFCIILVLDKRYKENIFKFYDIWNKHFTEEETMFEPIFDPLFNGKKINSIYFCENNIYFDKNFLNEFVKIYKISYKHFIYRTNISSKNKKCCLNFIRINNDGSISDFPYKCFNDLNFKNINLYNTNMKNFYSFPITTCENNYHNLNLCEYNTQE